MRHISHEYDLYYIIIHIYNSLIFIGISCRYLGYLMSSNGLAFAFGPGLQEAFQFDRAITAIHGSFVYYFPSCAHCKYRSSIPCLRRTWWRPLEAGKERSNHGEWRFVHGRWHLDHGVFAREPRLGQHPEDPCQAGRCRESKSLQCLSATYLLNVFIKEKNTSFF